MNELISDIFWSHEDWEVRCLREIVGKGEFAVAGEVACDDEFGIVGVDDTGYEGRKELWKGSLKNHPL